MILLHEGRKEREATPACIRSTIKSTYFQEWLSTFFRILLDGKPGLKLFAVFATLV